MARNECQFSDSKNDLNSYWGSLMNFKLNHVVDYTQAECCGVMKGDKPLVAWAYHSFLQEKNHSNIYLEGSVTICAFSKKWHPLTVIPKIFSLYFKNNCYTRLTAVTHKSNIQANRLLKLSGFTLEGVLRKEKPLEDLNQYSILKSEWVSSRWAVSQAYLKNHQNHLVWQVK
jgi:hypothetical protein